jgi:hypothetical protein
MLFGYNLPFPAHLIISKNRENQYFLTYPNSTSVAGTLGHVVYKMTIWYSYSYIFQWFGNNFHGPCSPFSIQKRENPNLSSPTLILLMQRISTGHTVTKRQLIIPIHLVSGVWIHLFMYLYIFSGWAQPCYTLS